MSDVDQALPEIAEAVAIIMDGNARWARGRGLAVDEGHRAGSRALRPVVEAAIDIGVRSLAVFAFSTENWSRPQAEVELLMDIFSETIDRELPQEKVRDPQLAGGADQQVGIGHLRRVQIRRIELLVDLVRVGAGLDDSPGGLDQLRASPVVERDPELQPVPVRRCCFELGHLALQLQGSAVAAPHESRSHAFACEVL